MVDTPLWKREPRIASAGASSERQQVVGRDAQLGQPALEVVAYHVLGEVVVAGRNGGMRGEYGVGSGSLDRAGEVEPLFDQHADALQQQERRMSLVDVPDRRRDAERGEGAHAADAEDDFLLDARGAVAAIETVRDGAVGGAVLWQRRVEQVKPHMADARLPHLEHDIAPGHGHGHLEFRAVLAHQRRDGQVVEIRVGVLSVLVALVVDGLEEVALPVQQSDADEGQAEIACGLAMVPGENAQAAGIDRQAFVETEFGAEVRNEVALAEVAGFTHARRLRVVGVVGRQHAVVGVEEDAILRGFVQPPLRDALEERLRAVAAAAPEGRVQAGEQRAGGAIPAIPQVVGEFVQPLQPQGKLGIDLEQERRAGHGGSVLRCY